MGTITARLMPCATTCSIPMKITIAGTITIPPPTPITPLTIPAATPVITAAIRRSPPSRCSSATSCRETKIRSAASSSTSANSRRSSFSLM